MRFFKERPPGGGTFIPVTVPVLNGRKPPSCHLPAVGVLLFSLVQLMLRPRQWAAGASSIHQGLSQSLSSQTRSAALQKPRSPVTCVGFWIKGVSILVCEMSRFRRAYESLSSSVWWEEPSICGKWGGEDEDQLGQKRLEGKLSQSGWWVTFFCVFLLHSAYGTF